jgi:hypothetical protein
LSATFRCFLTANLSLAVNLFRSVFGGGFHWNASRVQDGPKLTNTSEVFIFNPKCNEWAIRTAAVSIKFATAAINIKHDVAIAIADQSRNAHLDTKE